MPASKRKIISETDRRIVKRREDTAAPTREIESRDRTIAELEGALTGRDAQISAFRARIAELEKHIASEQRLRKTSDALVSRLEAVRDHLEGELNAARIALAEQSLIISKAHGALRRQSRPEAERYGRDGAVDEIVPF